MTRPIPSHTDTRIDSSPKHAPRKRRPRGRFEQVGIGLLMIAVGVVMVLERAGIFEGFDPGLWWPSALAGLGVVKCLADRWVGGIALIALGVALQLDRLGHVEFIDTWPAILIAAGIALAIDSLRRSPTSKHEEVHHG